MRLSGETANNLDASNFRFAIVCARFNETITHALLDGAVSALRERGATDEQIEIAWVPGSFELPLAAQQAASRRDIAAVICLGAVIRGETPHFDFVSHAAATGILRVSLDSGKPVTFGVLTTDTPEQARERAGGKVGNKGADAAIAALEMVHLLSRQGGASSPL
jgi:6,7-dimethyl-8-ribityllumazine synthase